MVASKFALIAVGCGNNIFTLSQLDAGTSLGELVQWECYRPYYRLCYREQGL
jgi:hypothetical protein